MNPRETARFVVFFLVTLVIVFGPAGTLHWLNGWLFMTLITLSVASVSFGIFPNQPDLILERKTAARNAPLWDKILVPLVTGLPFLSILLAGFGKRLGWEAPFPGWAVGAAWGGMAAGSVLIYAAMKANRFFSSYMRIQTNRGHRVIDRGPYAFVRHPGYVGSLLFSIGTPVLLNSIPALKVAGFTAIATVLRTYWEDRTLQEKLPGYREYAKIVRYRLVPFLW